MKRTRGPARSIRITPLGHAILEAVARGTYKFFKASNQPRNPDGTFSKDRK